MDTYDINKRSIRPEITNLQSNSLMTSEERFQNETLRPILKMQHELIRSMVKHYFKLKKNAYYNLAPEQRPDYIKNKLLADQMVRHQLTGMILGHFTTDEIDYYITNQIAINKRIQSLLFQRIMSMLDKTDLL